MFRRFYYKEIKPTIPIGTTLDFSEEQVKTRLVHGYKMAQKAFGTFNEIEKNETPESVIDTQNTITVNIGTSKVSNAPSEDENTIASSWDV